MTLDLQHLPPALEGARMVIRQGKRSQPEQAAANLRKAKTKQRNRVRRAIEKKTRKQSRGR